MLVRAIKTHKITTQDKSIYSLLDQYVKKLEENSVLAITSKIVSITQDRVENDNSWENKKKLIEKEADLFFPPSSNKYNVYLTIKNNNLIPSAGIDESNANGNLVLWPEKLQETTNLIRAYLQKKFKLKNLGVIIVDSRVLPLKWGSVGFCLSHSGFLGLNNLIGESDLFGKEFVHTMENVRDGLSAAAVLCMGEGREQTPLAILEDIPFVQFQKENPSDQELSRLQINIDDDVFAPLLKSVKWKKGKK